MAAMNTLIWLAVIAWLGQIVLGWLQLQNFNRALTVLAHTGQVTIGRSGGRFKPRVVLALSLDDQQRVIDNLVMKGITIFARPAHEPKLNGLRLNEIQPQILFPKSTATQQALALAISHKG